MASLYTIQEELLKLFGEIEMNDGEVTDEQLELLNIKEEELSTKLNDYYKAIQSWKADMAACKEEEKRIATTRKKYENRIERLKTVMLDTVNMFGSEGKTNKFIELSTVRLFTKNSKSIEFDEERINIFIRLMVDFINEAESNDCLYTGEDVDLEGIISVINAHAKAEYGEDFAPFTIDDMQSLHIDVVHNDSFANMFKYSPTCLKLISKLSLHTNIKPNTLKDNIKVIIERKGDEAISIAHININQSLQMK